MLSFHLITIHPDMFKSYLQVGIVAGALQKKLAQVDIVDLRQFAVDKHGSVDARPYGGGDGMVLRPEPLAQAIHSLREQAELPLMLS